MSAYKVNPSKINWDSNESILLFNERHRNKNVFFSSIPRLPYLKEHVWLATSGRTHQKWVALSKKALFTSAHSVNQHLATTAKDKWLCPLPRFHVGGLSIMVRSYLSGSSVLYFDQKWSSKEFIKALEEHKINFTSLVPAQVYDIVVSGLSCPSHLKAVLVGGGDLSQKLYQAARELKWPLLPSYGLTECSSQVATASMESLKKKIFPKMIVLPHVKLKIINQEIVIQSESLLTGFLILSSGCSFQDPKKKGWYFTGDIGDLQGNFLKINDRQYVKILGEKLVFKELQEILMNILLEKSFYGKCFLLLVPDERSELEIALVTDSLNKNILMGIIKTFNQRVSPFERIRQFYFLPSLPLTDISKLSEKTLLEILGFPKIKRTC